jgi:hypothetical protein
MDKFNRAVFIEHGVQMTKCLTISRIALTKYMKYYLNDYKLPLINKLSLFNFINFGYYGGITEVYIPYGKDLYYYDVNSLYPFVAGLDCTYIEDFSGLGLDLDNLFGFFHAQVETVDNLYIGLLPIRTEKGLILPEGKYEGV